MYINFVCTSVSLSIERSTQYVYTLLEKDHFHMHCVCTCVYKLCVCVCRENEPGWEVDIREDVLEECSQFGAVLHIYVDKLSQGNVYVKCMTAQTATAAFANLNGRFFAGNGVCFNVYNGTQTMLEYVKFYVFKSSPSVCSALHRQADCGSVCAGASLSHQVSSFPGCHHATQIDICSCSQRLHAFEHRHCITIILLLIHNLLQLINNNYNVCLLIFW